jgi:hypothetical protein
MAAAPAQTRRSTVPESHLPRRTAAASSAVLLLAAQLAAPPARAMEVAVLDVVVAGDQYRIVFEALVDAPVERVAGVLTDYVGYVSLDPRIRSSEVIGVSLHGEPLVRTRIRACAAFFCRDVIRLERVTVGEGMLVAEAIPGRSDVRSSASTEWQPAGGRTRIIYKAEFTPDFWVPAIVSHGYAANQLRGSVRQLFENVEERARGP